MVTLEEEHSTRGRAHMLFELLQGEVVRGGWKDEHVKTCARSLPFVQGMQVGVSRPTWISPRIAPSSCRTITKRNRAR